MKKTYALSAVAGLTVLAIAMPAFAQSASTDATTGKTRPVPTQACVQAMVTNESLMMQAMDTKQAGLKVAQLAHLNALKAAAALTDETARRDALKKANEDMKTAMQTLMQPSADMQATRDALKTACGTASGEPGGLGMRDGGPGRGGMMGAKGGAPGVIGKFKGMFGGKHKGKFGATPVTTTK